MTVEMACKNCKHWDEKPDWQEEVKLRHCTAIREGWKVEDDGWAMFTDRDTDERFDDTEFWGSVQKRALNLAEAVVWDGSSYSAMLQTGPDFFCKKFEKMEANK